jgi:pimeloyl-ACP methyl ester carboxylesterase
MLNRPDNRALFIAPPVPVHYMIGEDDVLIPVKRIKELLAECGDLVFQTVKDATHFLVVEKPDTVKDFIFKSLNN